MSSPEHILYQVRLPHATFGLLAVAGQIQRAAPIAGWARGKPSTGVLRYYQRRGALIVVLTPQGWRPLPRDTGE